MTVPLGFEKIPIDQSVGGLPPGFQKIPAQDADEEVKLSFAQRLGGDIFDRVQMLEEIKNATSDGEQSYAEGVLQVAGKVGAGLALDLLGESVVSMARGVSNITPDMIEDPVMESANSAFNTFLNTGIGKAGLLAAEKGADAWDLYRLNNPRAARNIESVVDIGMLVAPVSRSAAPVKPNILSRTATRLDDAVEAQVNRRAESFFDDLVRPADTKATRIDEVGRTAEMGILRQKVSAPSAAEQRMASAVSRVDGVDPSKTMQGNYNAIAREVTAESERLGEALKQSGALVPRQESKRALDLARQRLEQMPTMVGDAAKSAVRIIDQAKKIIDENPGTSSGVLDARRQLDAWIRKQKPAVFDPASENAMSMAVREVRQSLNNLIDAKNPSQGVRDSLSFQSNLLGAMDNISVKAAAEGKNIVSRTWRNVSRILPMRGEFNQSLAVLMGVGGLGAAAAFAPYFTQLTGLFLGSYATGKLVTSQGMKKAISMLLKKTDQAIQKAVNPDMARQLRLDRAALLELLDKGDEENE